MSRRPVTKRSQRPVAWLVLGCALGLAGCSTGVETGYGRSRTRSINGTGVLADLYRANGHEVRAAVRLTDELSGWADVLVRFAPAPGPPPKDEAKWYADWLNAAPGRRVVFVARDYDAEPDYWSRALEQLPGNAPARLRERAKEALDEAKGWASRLPAPPKEVAAPEDWFSLKDPAKGQAKGKSPLPRVCKTLGGPWAVGADAEKAALPVRKALKVDSEEVLLTGDGDALAMSWTRYNGGRIVALANGAFLLNAALAANPARRPLARRVVDWSGYSGDEEEGREGQTVHRRVAFVEGPFVLLGGASAPSVFSLLSVAPFGIVAAQLLALGLAACLARAPRLGRARPEEPTGAERPVAHPEALGALLARAGRAAEARSLLESYRRWRFGPARGSPKDG